MSSNGDSCCFVCSAVGVPQERQRPFERKSSTFNLLSELLKIRTGDNENEVMNEDYSQALFLCTACSEIVQDLRDLQELLDNTRSAIRKKVRWIRNAFRDGRKSKIEVVDQDQVAEVPSISKIESGESFACEGGFNDSILWKIEPEDSESGHSFEEPVNEFLLLNYGEEYEENAYEGGVTPDDTRKEMAEEATNEDCNIHRRLLALHGLDKQPQPRISLKRIQSQDFLLKRAKLKKGRTACKTESHEKVTYNQATESDTEPLEECEEYENTLQNDDDPDFVPSESPHASNKKKIKQRRRNVKSKSASSFRRKRRATEEMKKPGSNRLECDVCGRSIILSSLNYHQWSHKSEEEKQEWLASGRPNPLERDKHKNEIARKQSRHECTICGKRFPFAVGLKLHSEIHKDKSQRETYMCEECGLICHTKNGLKFHISRKHKPFLSLGKWRFCPICPNVKYLSRTHLETHMMRHHGAEKKFICDQCGHRFPSKESLKKHLHVHLINKGGERPFECEYCEMNYKHRMNLARHVRNSHPDKYVPKSEAQQVVRPVIMTCKRMYPCEYCDKPFELLSRMKKHLLNCKKKSE